MDVEPTVFMIDDDDRTRDEVRRLVETMNLKCREFWSGQEFVRDFDPSEPGCIVLEIRVPEVSGLQIQRRLAAEQVPTPLIFLTGHADVSIAVHAMRAGALHVLEKPFREYELWDTIHEAIELDRERRQVWSRRQRLRERAGRLTVKERRLMDHIAQGKSNKLIAREMGVCVRTVELHRANLMKKLEVKSLAELLHFALQAHDGNGVDNGLQGHPALSVAGAATGTLSAGAKADRPALPRRPR